MTKTKAIMTTTATTTDDDDQDHDDHDKHDYYDYNDVNDNDHKGDDGGGHDDGGENKDAAINLPQRLGSSTNSITKDGARDVCKEGGRGLLAQLQHRPCMTCPNPQCRQLLNRVQSLD